jgi:hypothetical protein
MTTRVTPSQLDYNQIRSSLKAYFQNSGRFVDYDFDASGLAAILDVLAYNTHIQAMTANITLNEAFLDTAQLRSSVVSLAKPLNYLPRSKTSARATVDVTISGTPSGEVTLPKYTKFTGQGDGKTYTFYTLDDYVTDEAGDFIFRDVILYEGKLVTKRFIVDADQSENPLYVIPDEAVYVDSLEILIRDGIGSTSVTSLHIPLGVADFGPEEDIYLIAESASGYYELTFGDNIVGKRPLEGSIIEAKYLATAGPDANLVQSFSTTLAIEGLNLAPATTIIAEGGAEKESIQSIKFNAPKAYAAQNRAVTVADYKALIQNSVSYVEAINVWGGETHEPPEYGKVFISIKPLGADELTEDQKATLVGQVLAGRNIISIQTEFVAPEYQYVELRVDIRYLPGQTSLTKQQLENKVKQAIADYGTDSLVDFASSLRRSALLTYIDQVDTAITASDTTVKIQRRLKPTLGVLARYDLRFNGQIAAAGTVPVLTSDVFQYVVDEVTYNCYLRNKTGSYSMEVYRKGSAGDIVVVDDVGYFTPLTGVLTLLPFGPSGVNSAVDGIRITMTPADQNVILPRQNRLIRIDSARTSVTATADE